MDTQMRKQLVSGATLLFLAVLFGAFGAHGLKQFVSPEKLITFETGVRYHFYHGFGIILLALTKRSFPEIKLNSSFICFVLGIIFFSLNCYLYVLTGIKFFAMIVPIGGLLFMIGWMLFAWNALRLR
jgi:uncharacterized membrane protein YgdD (TMEM256/DUF423 family)